MKVVSTYDEEADFSKFKTSEYLGWSSGSQELVNQVDKDRIVEAVGAELRSRSFERVNEGADLLVSLFLVLNVETITADDNLESREKNIPKSIAKIMAKFPVKP